MIDVVFYCYMVNDWEERVEKQIKRLVSSGLYQAADNIYLFVTDTTNEQKDKIELLIKELPKINLDYTNTNYGEAFKALSKISEISKDPNHKILYFHTKGVYNKYKNFETKEIDDLKLRGVGCWVEMMEHFLIDNWKDCVDKLENNDIVGVTNHGGWWWGNFWWTRSSFVNTITPFDKHYNGSRWSAESWLHDANPNKENNKIHELNKFCYDPHYSVLPKYFYDKTVNLEELKIEVIQAEYGFFAEQRDEGRNLSTVNKHTLDVTENAKKEAEINGINMIPQHIVNNLEDPAPGLDKQVRIKFKTNIDPENEYIITSIHFWRISVAS